MTKEKLQKMNDGWLECSKDDMYQWLLEHKNEVIEVVEYLRLNTDLIPLYIGLQRLIVVSHADNLIYKDIFNWEHSKASNQSGT